MNAIELDQIEISSNEYDWIKAAKTVVCAGIWLMRNGYGRLGMLPYAAPSGNFWRCEFYPPGQQHEPLYRYSTGQLFKYLENHSGDSIAKRTSGAKLAQAIMASVPESVKTTCSGDLTPELRRWLDGLDTVLSLNLVPEAFSDHFPSTGRWRCVGAPGGPLHVEIDSQPSSDVSMNPDYSSEVEI